VAHSDEGPLAISLHKALNARILEEFQTDNKQILAEDKYLFRAYSYVLLQAIPKNHGSHNRQPIAVLTHPNMYSVIIIWQKINTRQTQYSFQQTTKAPHTFPYPNSETPTMTTNELWNVNTLKIPSTITAANDPNDPSPHPSPATILSG
jgi:hypothetical protein